MSSGSRFPWRLLSPLVALLWVGATVGFAGTAQADTSTGPAPAATVGQDHQTQYQPSTTGRSTAASETASSETAVSEQGGTSGDPSSPQPISTADANTGGSNGQCPGGPYCSTRDGSSSANGSGDGKAVGEPCAGCVGKADNKNPQGQKPDASDPNAGYECDTNHGIAQTNPAHTGCLTAPPPECVPTPDVPCVSVPECVPTAELPCVSPPQGGPPAPPQVSPPIRTGLPNTGAPADAIWLSTAALISLVSGGVLLLSRRRPLTG
jgi:LPXTG-motif cell wall-anchored protein